MLCLFDKATRPRDRPRRTALTVMSLTPRRATRSRRGQVRSCTRVLAYYAHRVRDVIRSQARVRVPICIPVLDISYTERRQVPRHWEERRAELGGPVHDPRLRATHRARATGTRMPVEDECHRRSWVREMRPRVGPCSVHAPPLSSSRRPPHLSSATAPPRSCGGKGSWVYADGAPHNPSTPCR